MACWCVLVTTRDWSYNGFGCAPILWKCSRNLIMFCKRSSNISWLKQLMIRKIILQFFWENGAFGGSNIRSRVFERNIISLWLKRRWRSIYDVWGATIVSHIHCWTNSKSNLAKVVELKAFCWRKFMIPYQRCQNMTSHIGCTKQHFGLR